MITDGFLSWTADSAAKFNIPRLVSYGMSNFAWAVFQAVGESRLLQETELDDELFAVPHFPWLKVTRNDFEEPFTDREPKGPHHDMIMEQVAANARSYGFIMNSFYELESAYVDFLNRDSKSNPSPNHSVLGLYAWPNHQKPNLKFMKSHHGFCGWMKS